MAERNVVWTATATKQRRAILKYWTLRNQSVQYAEKLIILINERIKLILVNPELFKLTTYPETRESAMGHFSIYYKIFADRIVITAFWDNRQDPKMLLEFLKAK